MTIRVMTPQGMAAEAIERRLREMEADILAVLGVTVTCVRASEPVVTPMSPDGLDWLLQLQREKRPTYADSETSTDEDWAIAVNATIRDARARQRRRAQR